jgi:prophage antirepressor-like protein
MNDIQIFDHEIFGEIRIIAIDGKPHFIAADVARALGYKNTHDAILRHCRWVAKREVPHPQSPTKTLEVNVMPEGDLYRMVAGSELPEAQKFEAWIFDEVLPSVRKTGSYFLRGEPTNLTGATSYIKLLYRSMEVQGHTARAIAEMIELVASQYDLPIPPGFVREPPFDQLTYVVNAQKQSIQKGYPFGR